MDWDSIDQVLSQDTDGLEEYKRLRRLPPETDEYGAATLAEQVRMTTGPVPGTVRLRRTPGDDPWYGRAT
jgi:hypothetical protein